MPAEASDRRQEDLQLDVSRVWEAATDTERRVLVEELDELVTVFPDHLEVKIASAPRPNVTLSGVELSGRESQNVGVGGPSATSAGPST